MSGNITLGTETKTVKEQNGNEDTKYLIVKTSKDGISATMKFLDEEGYEFSELVEHDVQTGEFRVRGKSEKVIAVETRQTILKLVEAIMKKFHVDAETARDAVESLTSENYNILGKAEGIAEEITNKGFAYDLVDSLNHCRRIQNIFDWLNVLENPDEVIKGEETKNTKELYEHTENVRHAVREYLNRKSRTSNPYGDFDSRGRWYPEDDYERQACCARIPSPTKNFPYSLMRHCRTAKHVSQLYGISEKELKEAVARQRYIL